MSCKYIQIADHLKRRIENGDFSLSNIPGAQKLARETGCSYLTVRQAVQKLINDGVLKRGATGRLDIASSPHEKAKLKVAVIRPSWEYTKWDPVLFQVAEEYGCYIQNVFFSHNDDPVVFDAINSDFDLIFIYATRTDMLFVEKLKKHKDKLVTLFHNFTEHGIRCLDGVTPEAIHDLIGYHYQLGHRKISCLNTDAMNTTIQERVKLWKHAIDKLGISGEFYNFPGQNFYTDLLVSRDKAGALIDSGKLDCTTLFCPTINCALGSMRAFYDRGIKVPEDISICSFGNHESAVTAIPSITVIATLAPHQPIRDIFDVFTGNNNAKDRLMFRVEGNPLLVGESSGPPKKQESKP